MLVLLVLGLGLQPLHLQFSQIVRGRLPHFLLRNDLTINNAKLLRARLGRDCHRAQRP